MSIKTKIQNIDLLNESEILREGLIEAINHGILVSNLAVLLARELQFDEEFCYDMALAGMLHDIGKLKICQSIYGVDKSELVVEGMNQIRMHPTLGYEIVTEYQYNTVIRDAIYHHHENFDGSGYPHNLTGGFIPFGSKILRICDVFAALVSNRPYRHAFDIETAMELMILEVKNFDMNLFLAFLKVVHSEEFAEVEKFIHSLQSPEESANSEVACNLSTLPEFSMDELLGGNI